MKKNHVWLAAGLMLWASASWAQTALAPGEEFRLIAAETRISLSRGEQDSVKISLVRSKRFKTAKPTITPDAPAATGLTMAIKPLSGKADTYVLYVSASADAKTGEYNFIPTFTLNGKSKGIVMKLIIK